MDALRGAAIILVVHFHVTENIAKYSDAPKVLIELTDLIAPLRMPILVLLSGLLVSNSILKGKKKYFSGKIKNIAYPFLIWTVIMYALSYAKEVYLGDPMQATLLQALTVMPLYHLWFLEFLFVYFVVIYYLKNINPLIILLGVTSLYIIFYGYGDDRLLSLFIFFNLGYYVGKNLDEVSKKIKTMNPIFMVISTFLAVIFSKLNMENELLNSNVYYLLSALFFIPILIRIFMLIEDTKLSRFLEFFGIGSLIIYLVHLPVITVVFNILKIAYPGSTLSAYFILMIATVIISVAILYASRKFKIVSFLFSPKKLENNRSLEEFKIQNHEVMRL